LLFYPLQSSHIGSQDCRNFNRPVRLLVIFQDGHHGSSDGQSGPIERMDKVGLGLFLSPGCEIKWVGSLCVIVKNKIEVDRRAMGGYPPEDLLAARVAFNEYDIRSVSSFRSAV